MLTKMPQGLVWLSLLVVSASVVMPVVATAQEATAPETTFRKVTYRAKVVYPPLGRSLHLNGTVKLMLRVGVDGKVKTAKVTGGHPVLASAAVDAAKQWVFAPGPKETDEPASFQFDYALTGK